ncbi:hypothetical protein OR1_03000 [Geobacter sp. OR-1]|uniref:hypothetical protein n=1 Tax=Geobacter sp. OR-1 TaxID=1266765 RepID=UPI0005421632|nr:hypothetical protein [Geobacter sp. OR-1]GAM10707.1 hypothetical protein OR1_03000 [Geobacter sp. OR-1]
MNRKYTAILLAAILVLIAAYLMQDKFADKASVKSPLAEKVLKPQAEAVAAQPADEEEPADASSEIAGKWYGLCKKNSIHSIEDFRKLVANDPVLAKHFAGFDWKNARLGRLEESLLTYVSYRKGSTIKQTRKPVRLPKGDRYITDGTRYIRTYCCNDYVIAPPPSESSADPQQEIVAGPARQLSAGAPYLSDIVSMAALQGMAGAPGQNSSGAPTGGIDLPTKQVPYLTPLEVPPVVPIPGTFLLFGSGAAGLGILRTIFRKMR